MGGRYIPASVTGGWHHGGERCEESGKNREVPPSHLGGQISDGAGWGEHKWEKEEKTKFDSFLRVYQVAEAAAASC